MSNNFPSIGDIHLDPSEKFAENGVDKYDLLLCDGSEIDPVNHPVLADRLGGYDYGNYVEYIVQCLNYTDGTRSLDHTDVLQPSYPVRYGNTAGKGLPYFASTYQAPAQPSDASLNVVIPIEEVWQPTVDTFLLEVYNNHSIGTTVDASLVFLDEGEQEVYRIVIDTPASQTLGMLTSIGGGALVRRPASGGNIWTIAGHFTDEGTGIGFTSTGGTVASFSEVFDTTGISSLVFTASVHHSTDRLFWSGLYLARVPYSANTPSITSPDPQTPYRIVADLTQEI